MSVISKRFADELTEKRMRDAYLSAQTRTKLTQQIRAIRNQRGWSQGDFAAILGKPQSNVSRLESRDYGNFTLKTLFDLASTFNCGLVVEFVPYEEFLHRTHDLSPENLRVPTFSEAALRPLYEQEVSANYNIGVALPIVLGGTILNNSTIPTISFTASGFANIQSSGINSNNISTVSVASLQVENERLRQQLAERDRRIAHLEHIAFPNPNSDSETGFSRFIPIRGIQQQSLQA